LHKFGYRKGTAFHIFTIGALLRFVKLVIFMRSLAAALVKSAYMRARGEIAPKKLNAH
jgi:hypothetical protein